MHILSLKPGHDGQVAYLADGKLVFSIEAEKDSGARYEGLTPNLMLTGLAQLPVVPDIMCEGGWIKSGDCERFFDTLTGYHGWEASTVYRAQVNCLGKRVEHFSSSHERSHLMCVYGMSPFPQGQPCYVLVCEGAFGAFYFIDEQVRIHKLDAVVDEPGQKYTAGFIIADEKAQDSIPYGLQAAGKVMALAAYGDPQCTDKHVQELHDEIMRNYRWPHPRKDTFRWSPLYNGGIRSQVYKDLARKVSDTLFSRFFQYAEQKLERSYPLLIVGGCGLNCEWNSQWFESGLFTDVFVPPCTNDSGSAIGTAIDAQFHATGNAKIEWSVYAGLPFAVDETPSPKVFANKPLDYQEVARFLADGNIIAWVQGKYEIGPRALGNRSLLAAPFAAGTKDRLNAIKRRDDYRPVAPVVMEEEAERLFRCSRPSPYMLYFQKHVDPALQAVMHVDGSARAQTVNRQQNPPLYDLLSEFRALTGFGALCNTSLNFVGAGFINRMSHLALYAENQKLDGFVVNDVFYTRRKTGE